MKRATDIILAYLKEKGISKSFLAEKIGETPQSLSNKLGKSDLTTDYIRRISEALNHNFFADLAEEFAPQPDDWIGMMVGERPEAYTVSKSAELQKWKRIMEKLPDELEYIKKQLDQLNQSK